MTVARVLGPQDGEFAPPLGGVTDRFMIDGKETSGRFSLVQDLLDPKALAAPMHRHHDEDEYLYVVSGRIGAVLGDEEVTGGAGDLISMPRDEWHTFWNAGDDPASVLILLSPGGLEDLFRRLADFEGEIDADTMAALAAEWHCDVDFETTMPIAQRHSLVF